DPCGNLEEPCRLSHVARTRDLFTMDPPHGLAAAWKHVHEQQFTLAHVDRRGRRASLFGTRWLGSRRATNQSQRPNQDVRKGQLPHRLSSLFCWILTIVKEGSSPCQNDEADANRRASPTYGPA